MAVVVNEGRRVRAAVLWATILLLGVVVLSLNAGTYVPFLADDALISLRYGQRLLNGHGLSWTDGAPVEGYSNLLWILALAIPALSGIDWIVAARGLGLCCMATALLALSMRRRSHPLSELAAVGTFALSGSVAVWAIGGLEQPLVAALLAWALLLARPLVERPEARFRAALNAGLLFALLCLARPDGPLFAAAAAAAVLIARGPNRAAFAAAAGLLVLPLLFVLAQLVFRLNYYGEWLPNTAFVKLRTPGHHGALGLAYLENGLLALIPISPLAFLALLASWSDRARRGWLILLVLPALTWAAYLVWIEGDIFPAWRHFVPLLVVFALLLGCGDSKLGFTCARADGRRSTNGPGWRK